MSYLPKFSHEEFIQAAATLYGPGDITDIQAAWANEALHEARKLGYRFNASGKLLNLLVWTVLDFTNGHIVGVYATEDGAKQAARRVELATAHVCHVRPAPVL